MMEPTQRTAFETQQELAYVYGSQDAIFWDLFSAEQKCYLSDKIKLLIPDAPIFDVDAIFDDYKLSEKEQYAKIGKLIEKMEKENKKLDEFKMHLTNTIWDQRKYNDGNLLMSIIFVICVPEIPGTIKMDDYKQSSNFTCHPIFRIRKCIIEDNSENCCMIFVDESARVYQNWQDFKDNNELPKGIVIAPRNGIYNFNTHDKVILEYFKSRAAQNLTKIVEAGDKSASVLGLTACAVPIAALVTTVAAPVLVTSAIIGGAAGIWSMGRSAGNLWDRGAHEQSINITNRQARSSWFGVVGGAVGVAASSATQGLIKYAAKGNDISNVTRGVVSGLNVASMTVNGTAIGNGAVELYLKFQHDEEISTLDIIQLSASLFLFTHSVYNFQSTKTLIENSKDGTIKSFRKSLSNARRKIFDKMYKNTIAIKGSEQGKIDVIRSINAIPDPGQVLSDIKKINKDLNKSNVNISFGSDGKVVLNNGPSVDSGVLRNNIQNGSGDILDNIPTAPSESIPAPSSIINPFNSTSTLPFELNRKVQLAYRILEVISNLVKTFPTSNKFELERCINFLYTQFCEEAAQKLINIAKMFVLVYGKQLESLLKFLLPIEKVLGDSITILTDLYGAVQYIDQEILNMTPSDIHVILRTFYQKFVPENKTIKCNKCRGYVSYIQLVD